MLSAVEQTKPDAPRATAPTKKAQLGQFFTPPRTAQFMAAMFRPSLYHTCRLLDPGAGTGNLTSAFIERHLSEDSPFDRIELTAYEIDHSLHEDLKRTLRAYKGPNQEKVELSSEVLGGDFIEQAVTRIRLAHGKRFTHALMNPPYHKISSDSTHRFLLRKAGIETVNLYSAFVALTLGLMVQGGQVVAIIPRSFCNGPYYRSFRQFILERASLRRIHLFGARDKAFKGDDVLQENVIVLLERGGLQRKVEVSTSTDDTFEDLETHFHPFNRIVFPDDPERFIHVPTSPEPATIEVSQAIHSLDDLGINVSTGPVVDFRMKEHLRSMPGPGYVPLLYPGHFNGFSIEWPKADTKKPNAIRRNHETEKWLYPSGFYCVVRRFSSKEEKRRIVASLVRPANFDGADMLGFENHLNVFHEKRHGLPEDLALGLAVFLSSTTVDSAFRRFNGHTQVNATDLKLMKYPARETLISLGQWAAEEGEPSQAAIDREVGRLTK